MNKKIMLVVVIIIILICGMGIFIFGNNSNSNSNKLNMDHIQFSLPDGYNQIDNNQVKIGNGNKTFSIATYNGTNVSSYVNSYIAMKSKENKSVNIEKLNVGSCEVYKSNLPDEVKTVHYWFKHGNNVVEISTLSADDNTDNIVTELIQSAS